MSEARNDLINALRQELQQYGEMLARLDYQQDLVMDRAPSDLLQSSADIESQSQVVQSARQWRIERQREVALSLGLAEEAAFAEIIPRLPEDYRPLVEALVQENNELLIRVQQRSRQNHLLLARSLEFMHRMIGTLVSGGSPVYTDKGNLIGGLMAGKSLYQAVG